MYLENKTTEITAYNEEIKLPEVLTYDKLIQILLNTPVQGGFTLTDVEHRVSLRKALKNMKDNKIQFENADGNYLKNLVATMKFPSDHEDILHLATDVKEMKSE